MQRPWMSWSVPDGRSSLRLSWSKVWTPTTQRRVGSFVSGRMEIPAAIGSPLRHSLHVLTNGARAQGATGQETTLGAMPFLISGGKPGSHSHTWQRSTFLNSTSTAVAGASSMVWWSQVRRALTSTAGARTRGTGCGACGFTREYWTRRLLAGFRKCPDACREARKRA